MMYPQWGSQWRSQHDSRQLQQPSKSQVRIRRHASLANIQETTGQLAIERNLHINTWKTSHGNSISSSVGVTPISWASEDLYCLWGVRWKWACTAGIQEGIWLSIWIIESTCYWKYWLQKGFEWSRWVIGSMESWKCVAIWGVCGWHDGTHHLCRIQCPDNAFSRSGDGHGTCEAYSHQLCNVCEALCHECVEDHPDS